MASTRHTTLAHMHTQMQAKGANHPPASASPTHEHAHKAGQGSQVDAEVIDWRIRPTVDAIDWETDQNATDWDIDRYTNGSIISPDY